MPHDAGLLLGEHVPDQLDQLVADGRPHQQGAGQPAGQVSIDGRQARDSRSAAAERTVFKRGSVGPMIRSRTSITRLPRSVLMTANDIPSFRPWASYFSGTALLLCQS